MALVYLCAFFAGCWRVIYSYSFSNHIPPPPHQEEVCDENFEKKCQITFRQQAINETVRKCYKPTEKVRYTSKHKHKINMKLICKQMSSFSKNLACFSCRFSNRISFLFCQASAILLCCFCSKLSLVCNNVNIFLKYCFLFEKIYWKLCHLKKYGSR